MQRDTMKIAIHERKGSFSDKWIEYCTKNKIPFEIVNCYNNDIIKKLGTFDALLWHWVFHVPGEVLIAKSILQTMELMGKVVFPNMATCWHYDNKIAQKYLLESIGAPLVPTYVFFDLDEALSWIEKTTFPKVFKLRTGAGSENVKLVKGREQARKLCKMAFEKGFYPKAGYLSDLKHKSRKINNFRTLLNKLRHIPITLKNIKRINTLRGKEIGYVYFQDFIPANAFDIRITVIGNRAFIFFRKVRKDDFRASGSGFIEYPTHATVDKKIIRLAFDIAHKLKSQSLAMDFIKDGDGNYLLIEISYCFNSEAVYKCPGHWSSDLIWNEGQVWPENAIIQDLLTQSDIRI